jgi:hypothetical protein
LGCVNRKDNDQKHDQAAQEYHFYQPFYQPATAALAGVLST